jgi:uncharacterized protein YjaZ
MSFITLPGGGPGYGSSLCESLVSEGLAGHFVLELFRRVTRALGAIAGR